jgi:hypothetical protein
MIIPKETPLYKLIPDAIEECPFGEAIVLPGKTLQRLASLRIAGVGEGLDSVVTFLTISLVQSF